MTAPALPASRRLTALDASFLHLERPGFPMHVGSISLYEGGPLRDADGRIRMHDLRRHLAARLPTTARWRLVSPFVGGRPHWVVDDRFDVANHVLCTAVDPPGGDAELLRCAAALHGRPLDRRRPLWEIWFVDGLPDGTVALVEKIHHALVDGLGGVDLGVSVLDLEPTPYVADSAGDSAPDPAPAPASRLRVTVDELSSRLGTVAGAALAPLGLLHPAGRQRVAHLVRGARTILEQPFAPPSPLNPAVGRRRALTVARCSLDDAKTVRRHLGGTINDVVLAVTAGALRSARVDVAPPRRPLHALMPVSERDPGQASDAGNRVAAVFVALPVDEADPRLRYERVRAATARLKTSGESTVTGDLLRAAELLPESASAAVARSVHRQPFVNLVVTNVPGPPVPLSLIGARLLEVVPIVPLSGNLSVSVAILSYVDHLTFGLMVDPDVWPDPAALSRSIEREMAALTTLALDERPPAVAVPA